MSSRRRPVSAIAAAMAVLLLSGASALAHGGEEETLAETPARSLVQQALGLLAQADDPAEAAERLEAALETEDTAGVALAEVREAIASLRSDDKQAAIERLNEALAANAERGGAADLAAAEDENEAHRGPAAEEPLGHTEEFEAERETEEWVGAAVGAAAILAGLVLLLAGHRRQAA